MVPDQAQHPSCPYPSFPPPVRVPLTVIPEHPCPYIPGRVSRSRAFAADTLDPDLYHRFMDAGFRRSGTVFYQPICPGCRACMQIRVPVSRFIPGKSQRRVRRRNEDLAVNIRRPVSTDETYDLYSRYVAVIHDGRMSEDREGFESFLCHLPVETLQIEHRDQEGKLLAVGICDLSPVSLSSVYFYYDPDEAWRSLGTHGALVEIELARRLQIPYYYLGYWVEPCAKMSYKANYRPCEVLHPDGIWRELT